MRDSAEAKSASKSLASSIEYSDRKLWIAFSIFLAAGAFFTLVNLHWPIARNGLCYAKAALGIIERHFDLFAIAHDRTLTSGKPIFFSALAAPFVWVFGANTGTIIASAIGTAFFLFITALALPRLNRLSGLNPSLMPLEFVLVACNPLVLYQFWSAYPDSLFAGLVLLAFVLTDVIGTEPHRDTTWHILGLGVTIYLAIHTKLYGAVLLITCPLYLLIHGCQLAVRSSHRTAKIGILAAVFALLVFTLVTAKLNINPLLDLADEAGFSGYVGGIVRVELQDVLYSLSMLGFAVLLAFHAALIFIATRSAWHALALAPISFAGIYLLGLLTFPGTSYNMRYFLAAFPFFVPLLAAGARSIGPAARRTILTSYGVIASVLVLTFNLAPVDVIVQPHLSKISARYDPLEAWLDNLRLPVHIALKRQIDAINADVPDGGLFYWSSQYYGTATHGLAEHLGVKKGLDIRYVLEPSEIAISPEPIFLTTFTSGVPSTTLWQAPDWATVKSVGYGLFRLDPISVELHSLSGDYVNERSPIRLQAKITIGGHLKVSTVEFLEGNAILGVALQPPYELTWQAPPPGRHEIEVRVGYGQHDAVVSESVIHVGVPALERTARTKTDVALEAPNGFVWPAYQIPDETLVMTAEESAIAIRFEKLDVPKGAHIGSAYLELTAGRSESRPATFEILGELSANAPALRFEQHDLSRRHRTTASVNWALKPWRFVGEQERSPNLTPILEEVVAQPGWHSGNAVVLFIYCSGQRVAQLGYQDESVAPRLYIQLRK